MKRSRLLISAAAIAAGCAFSGSAQAQISPCMVIGSPLPPPCIIVDLGKITEVATEIKNKKAQLDKITQQGKEYTDIQGMIGDIKLKAMPTFKIDESIAPLEQTTVGAARTEFSSALPKGEITGGERAGVNSENNALLRAAAGDGWAIAVASQFKLSSMEYDASVIAARIKCRETVKGTAAEDEYGNMRQDWQINTQARSLMLRAIAAQKEINAAKLNLDSVQAVTNRTMQTNVQDFEYKEAAAPVAAPKNTWAVNIGDIANLANKLQTLMTAKELAKSFGDSLKGARDTQAEYEETRVEAARAQAVVQNIANSDARKKNKSAASLLARADQIMSQMDRTSWDDPSKGKITETAAKRAESELDKMVKGDVNDNWDVYLQRRADAFKKEAFFRPISADAKTDEASTIAAIRDQETASGFQITDLNGIDKEIQKVQAELAAKQQALANAPADIQKKAAAITSNSTTCAGYVTNANGDVSLPCDMVQKPNGEWDWAGSGPKFKDTQGNPLPMTQ